MPEVTRTKQRCNCRQTNRQTDTVITVLFRPLLNSVFTLFEETISSCREMVVSLFYIGSQFHYLIPTIVPVHAQ